ncbi:MAG TPA: hypothetical protein VF184_01445, partial [Phycisphaeraceae bacterium]
PAPQQPAPAEEEAGPDLSPQKYDSKIRFHLTRLQRYFMRAILKRLASWEPLEEPQPGYTLLIGCPAEMTPVLHVNLMMIMKQQQQHLREVIVVFDQDRDRMGSEAERKLRQAFPTLPLCVLHYTPWQARLLRLIGWGWCYSWLSWSLGIAQTRTRYALLHDLDAMLLRRDLLEERYCAIVQSDAQYVGVRYYHGNGIQPQDRLAVTFELMFDARFVREHFEPIDLFNHVGEHRGRRVEYDTFLHAQHQAGYALELPVQPQDMVHPSQLFCQFTELKRKRIYTPPTRNSLPLLPYFFYLGGEEKPLLEQTRALDRAKGTQVPFFGYVMDLAKLSQHHLSWLAEQAYRLERAAVGQVRPEVTRYFESLGCLIARRDEMNRG